MMNNRTYISIDLKSFYVSVECIERGLDPLTTNLVVADNSRTERTICLAVSPSLKSYGIKGRPRLFEVVQKVREINALRLNKVPGRTFSGASCNYNELKSSSNISVDYIIAPPRMAYYIEYSTEIYNIYLKYIAPEDIHVYSIDEVFIDITNYLSTYNLSARELTTKILLDVLNTTGITATAGIGTNLYLAKIAMDILAKHIPIDKYGVQIAELDEMSYRRLLWSHRRITDFWRVGKGYAKRLEKQGLYTMGDIARCSIGKPIDYHNEDLLYKLFGVNAELLIDHAWGWESCTIDDIKDYKPSTKSIGSGQVLQSAYTYVKAKLIVWEMTDLLVLDLVDKRLVTNQVVLTVGYDRESLLNPKIKKLYKGEITKDDYGRAIPKSAHGTTNLNKYTSSTKLIIDAVMELFERIVDKNLLIRRVNISANNVVDKESIEKEDNIEQLNLFTDYKEVQKEKEEEEAELLKERKIQETILDIKKKYGKNAVLKGVNLEEGATTLNRNKQIGSHKA
ncbi:DNA polymerase V [Tissierella praeacuta DSM 18095]|uniref:DNA polymerase V n=2 Tax=Tissierella praeacuta TaxID=43131 RepID=A0A1M4UVC9_9FIRM|nr:DNA methylase [Tissierella praeacuta]SHE60597.1 DNA polymerase V [Tissierella praeacuta DSM 18095]SUP02621.1 DNA polymerase IV [Tissierella praeacuta]